MNISANNGNFTQLVFCYPDVNPDVITDLLDFIPSQSMKVGDPAEHANGHRYFSHVGIWKLDLPNANFDDSIEEQIGEWVMLLKPKLAALSRLKDLGYRPYLDCRALSGSLSLCVEPELLVGFGELNISLSVWLYEHSPVPSID